MKNKTLVANLLLLTTAILWGSSFTVRKIALEYVTPLFFNGLRFAVGFLCVLAFYLFMKRLDKKKNLLSKNKLTDCESGQTDIEQTNSVDSAVSEKQKPFSYRITIGFACGTALAGSAVAQQIALLYMDAGKLAFFTSIYAVLVPIIGFLFLKYKIPLRVWGGAVLALIGIYLLSGATNISFTLGDTIGLSSSLFFAIQVIIVDKVKDKIDGLFLCVSQLFFASIWNFALAFIFESGNSIENIMACIWPLLYCGVVAIGIPYTLQIIGQKNANPSVAAIILSMESVFGLLFSVIILNEALPLIKLIGCACIFAAVILAQLKTKKDVAKL